MKKKFLDNYNYHDWSGFMVKKPEQAPKGPHFAAVLFEKEHVRETDPYNGSNSDRHIDMTTYFAFPDKETLTQWVLRAAKAEKAFFCFEVKKIGGVQIKVNVDVEV